MSRRHQLSTRAWMAIAASTALVIVSFWSMAFGFVVGETGPAGGFAGESESIAGGSLALSLALVPLAFVTAAFVSRRQDPGMSVLVAMALALIVGLPLVALRDPLAALIGGFAAGAGAALSRPDGITWHRRAAAAAIVIVLVLIGNRLLPVVSFLLAPALPFTAVGLADLTED